MFQMMPRQILSDFTEKSEYCDKMIYIRISKNYDAMLKDSTSKQYFEEVADSWEDMGRSYFGDAPRARIYQELSIKPKMHIADIGCGSGYLIEGLLDKDVSLYGIDQSQKMLDQAMVRFNHPKNLKILVGTSESIPLGDATLDIVMANMYIHHVERPAVAIKEMARTLKPGGTLIFTDLDSHNYNALIEEQFDRWKGFDRSDIRFWLENAELRDIVIDDVGADCCTSSCSSEDIKISIFVAKGVKT
jgi:ubiquinone/menaquinone biosynthesis C-methylase UbiE